MRLLPGCQVPSAGWAFQPITGFHWPQNSLFFFFFWLQLCQLKWGLAHRLLSKISVAPKSPWLEWSSPSAGGMSWPSKLCSWQCWAALCFHPGSGHPTLCFHQLFWEEKATRHFEAVFPRFTATWTTRHLDRLVLTRSQEGIEATDSVRYQKEARNALANTTPHLLGPKRRLRSGNPRHPTCQRSKNSFTEATPYLSPAVSAAVGITAGASTARIQAEKTCK